jgi:hypothetical protein
MSRANYWKRRTPSSTQQGKLERAEFGKDVADKNAALSTREANLILREARVEQNETRSIAAAPRPMRKIGRARRINGELHVEMIEVPDEPPAEPAMAAPAVL